MLDEDTVEPQDNDVQDVMEQEVPDNQIQESVVEETKVPLSALQKERRKRQDLELELKWERDRQQKTVQQAPIEDDSKYESATRADLSKSQEESIRIIEERIWMKQNPEKYERVNENLAQFLKQRPNLAGAISSSTNRYEEAYTLMEALTPREQKQLRAPPPKKESPGSPASIPKSAAINQAVDVMEMSDSEFSAWRKSQSKRR